MEDEGKAKKQLISEVVEMRQCDAALNATKTGRRQAGRGVGRRESEALFRNLLDYIPGVSIQGYTADGIVRYWNKASEQIYGYTAKEAIGRNLEDLIIPPEVKHQFKQALELGVKCTKSGEFMPPDELMLLHKKGSLVPVYSIHTVVCLDGRPNLMYCIDVDLSERKRTEEALRKAHNELERRVEERTAELAKAVASLRKEAEERKRAEESLRESEKRYFLATSAGSVGVWDWNLDTNEIHVDPMLKAFLGYEDHEIRNHIEDWSKRVHPGDRERVMAETTKHLEGVSLRYEIEHRMLHKDGSIRWFLARGTAMRDKSGKPYRMLGTDTDITEHKQAEQKVRESEEKFTTLFQSAPVAMMLLDEDRQIRELNRAAQEAITRSALGKKGLVLGNVVRCIHSLEDPNGCGFSPSCQTCSMRRIIADTFQTGQPHYLVEAKLTSGDGREQHDNYLLVSTAPLKLPQEHNVLFCCQDITEQKQAEVNLRHAFSEIKQLKEQLETESVYLQDEIKLEHNFKGIIGQSNALNYVFLKIEQIASTDSTVLILGETGTGKELVARAIHSASPRNNRPLVKVNCAVLPRDLIESELFGHEKGAFTGAHTRQIGRFEVANGSTLFLDEIGELPLDLQAKLLMVLQDGEFERLGSSHTIKTDVRIIAATNRNPDEEIRKGRFRKDLYYRLNVFPITVPPLRKRTEDIPLLVDKFVNRSGKKLGKQIKTISNGVMKALQNYHWPGNIRELENMIERAVINTRGTKLQLADKIDTGRDEKMPAARRGTLSQVERDYILQVLEETDWKVSGKNGAAEILDINPNTLRGRMRKLGIQRT